jgi:pimeloyl-ACP methyl ester carboxylesterase
MSKARPQTAGVPTTSIHRVEADGVRVFYRAAGDATAPVVLLLHGFPASSFMFRDLGAGTLLGCPSDQSGALISSSSYRADPRGSISSRIFPEFLSTQAVALQSHCNNAPAW